jgi:hypothetical protein
MGEKNDGMRYLMEMRATPLCSMLSGMAIENGKESLTTNGVKVNDKGVSIFHSPSGALVLGDTDTEGGMICRMTIEDL